MSPSLGFSRRDLPVNGTMRPEEMEIPAFFVVLKRKQGVNLQILPQNDLVFLKYVHIEGWNKEKAPPAMRKELSYLG